MGKLCRSIAGGFALYAALMIATPAAAMDLRETREVVARTVASTTRQAWESVLPSAAPLRAQQQQQEQSRSRTSGRSMRGLLKLGILGIIGAFALFKWVFGGRSEA